MCGICKFEYFVAQLITLLSSIGGLIYLDGFYSAIAQAGVVSGPTYFWCVCVCFGPFLRGNERQAHDCTGGAVFLTCSDMLI